MPAIQNRSSYRNGLPIFSKTLYTAINFVSLSVLMASLGLLTTLPEWPYVAATSFFVLVLALGFCLSPLFARRAPEHVKHFLAHNIGPIAKHITYKTSRTADFHARNAIFSRICFVPPRAIEACQQGNSCSNKTRNEILSLVSHEIGHLVSGDSAAFQFSMAALLLANNTAVWTIAFLWKHGGDRVPLHASFALTITNLVLLYLLYRAIRVREFVADRIAADLAGDPVVTDFLQRMVKISSFVRFPLWYKLTHPAFAERLVKLKDYYSLYSYDSDKILIAGILLGFIVSSFPFGAQGIGEIFGPIGFVVFVVVGAVLPYYILALLVMPAVITGHLLLFSAIYKASVLVVIAGLWFLVWNFVAFGVTPGFLVESWGTASDVVGQALSGDPIVRSLGPILSTLVAHCAMVIGIRWSLCFRVDKHLRGAIFAKAGTSIALLSATATAGIITLFGVDRDSFILGLLIVGSCVALATLPWALVLRRLVGGRYRGRKDEPVFIWEEWDELSDDGQRGGGRDGV